jgi:protocatechuate 3,4-dioxygenase beta subunit
MGQAVIGILSYLLVLGVAAGGVFAQDCSWCGTAEAPETLSWSTTIASIDEPGERLVVTGTVYWHDGLTTALGVTIYLYHTNIEGTYPRRSDETGNGRRHGYLRGWVRTDSEGRYRFETIRPAPYQTHGGEPAHIHYTIQPPGGEEYWLNAAWFADDPRVTEELVAGLKRQGGFSNVLAVERDSLGVWRGQRDIVLEVYE